MILMWRHCGAVWRLKHPLLVLYTCVVIYLLTWIYPTPAYFSYATRPVNNFDYQIMIHPSHMCSYENKPSLVILVISTADNLEKRDAIRDTWGSISRRNGPVSVAVVFLFGESHHDTDNREIREEARRSEDVLQVGVLESYGLNVTRKIIAGMNWTLGHCPSASHVMKVDDDVFVDVPAVIRRLESSECGSTLCGHKVYVSVTKRSGKYVLSFKDYPYFFLPPFLFGYFYVMPRHVAYKLVHVARYVPLLRMEDVYITGVLPRIAQLHTTAYRGFFFDKDYSVELCDFVTGTRDVNIGVNPDMMHRVWETYSNSRLCGHSARSLR